MFSSSWSLLWVLSFVLCLPSVALAADKEAWRSRAIYQLLTDRFAPPSATAPALTSPLPQWCDPALQTWCGGTWRSIIDKLDYIQGMGMDAIWISPVSKNLDVETPYHFAYHGFWVTDPTQLNPRFGTADDLKALAAEVHKRNMFIMVDVVVNNVVAIDGSDATDSAKLKADGVLWTDPDDYHSQCWIDYNNQTSVENCWMGDDKLALMDVNTESVEVQTILQEYIRDFVQEYQIDGLRIDAAKHIPGGFWTPFCLAAGVFCTGEVYGSDIDFASKFQTEKYLDSILNFPMYYGVVDAFGQPNGPMKNLTTTLAAVQKAFPDPGLLGNFLENHDVPRWRNTTADPQLSYNALVWSFMSDGIPIVYYGQEQDVWDGQADPYNRNALWAEGHGNYSNSTTYERINTLNTLRKALISNGTTYEGKTFLQAPTTVVAETANDLAIRKGPVLTVLTNRGSPSVGAAFGVVNTGWPSISSVVDILSCEQFSVGSGQSISISYSGAGKGGMPYVFLSAADASKLGLCGGEVGFSKVVSTNSKPKSSASTTLSFSTATSLAIPSFALLLSMLLL